MRAHRYTQIAMTVAVLLTGGLASTAHASTAHAVPEAKNSATAMAGSCWSVWGTWYCEHGDTTPLYHYGRVVDHLYGGVSAVACRREAEWNNNGPHPYRWILAQGEQYGTWAWAKDIDIRSETNSLPVCR